MGYVLVGLGSFHLFKLLGKSKSLRSFQAPFFMFFMGFILFDLYSTFMSDSELRFLGLPRKFTALHLKANKRHLFERYHPDASGTSDEFAKLNELISIYGDQEKNKSIVKIHSFFKEDSIKLFQDKSANKNFDATLNEFSTHLIIDYFIAYFGIAFAIKEISRKFKPLKYVLIFILLGSFAMENFIFGIYDTPVSAPVFQFLDNLSIFSHLTYYDMAVLIRKIFIAVYFFLGFKFLAKKTKTQSFEEQVKEFLESPDPTNVKTNLIETKLNRLAKKQKKNRKNVNLFLLITLAYFAFHGYQRFFAE